MASYLVNGTPAAGPGIRSYPYSTNLAVNPLTYGQVGTANYSETHALGEVWAAVLWDLNWQFIYQYGYQADMFAATTGGNNKLLKLVLDACKIQICNPGFLDGRDALLRADTLTNGAANANLLWNVFARRGLGYAARQGDRVSGTPCLTGLQEDFSLPPTVRAVALASRGGTTVSTALEAYPNPAQDRLTVRASLPSAAPVQVVMLDLLGQPVLQATAPAAQLQQAGIELNTSQLAAGLYVVRVTTTEGSFTVKVMVREVGMNRLSASAAAIAPEQSFAHRSGAIATASQGQTGCIKQFFSPPSKFLLLNNAYPPAQCGPAWRCAPPWRASPPPSLPPPRWPTSSTRCCARCSSFKTRYCWPR
ncbi:MAG: M36 family metallopeptidase [Hymenobacter sp.]